MRYLFFIFIQITVVYSMTAQIELPDEITPPNTSADTIKVAVASNHLNFINSVEDDSFNNQANVPALFSRDSWSDFQDRIEKTGSKYYVDFTASWCAPCKVMDAQVFTDSRVTEITRKNYLAKQIDIDDFDGIAIAQKYQIFSLPTILIFDCNGQVIRRLEGLQYADMLVNQLLIHK